VHAHGSSLLRNADDRLLDLAVIMRSASSSMTNTMYGSFFGMRAFSRSVAGCRRA